ncbi:MAG: SpoIIE family protein phosphatase [Desulfobacterales bacterium]|nr:SpoIIE family protein phosphatase [Desulfobacterales bacterium]
MKPERNCMTGLPGGNFDHFRPKSKGGDDSPGNLIYCCNQYKLDPLLKSCIPQTITLLDKIMKKIINILLEKYLSLSLRNKFIIPTVTVMFIVFLNFAIYLINDQREKSEARLKVKADRIVYLLTYTNASNIWEMDKDALFANCSSFFKDEEVVSIKIKDKLYGIVLINLSKKIKGTDDIIKKADITRNEQKIAELEVVFTNYYIEENLSDIRHRITFLSLAMFFLIIVLISAVSSIALLPMDGLMDGVKHLTEGNLEFQIKTQSRGELGKLGISFNKMADELRVHRKELEQLVEKRTKELHEANKQLSKAMSELWGEMELAKKIQTVLLPEKPELLGYDIAASVEAADEVGGDYFDVISVNGYDWLIIGDVSGHGVSAGLVMMMVQTAIHTVLLENPSVPASHLLSVINRTIYENIERLGESKHMSIIVLAGGKEGIFYFAGSHEDILIRRADTGKVDEIKTSGMWIGLEPDITKWLSVDTLILEHGDCMVLYTDGITESIDEDGFLYGSERLINLIEKNGDKPASAIHQCIIDSLEPYQKPDDVTILIVKRKEP